MEYTILAIIAAITIIVNAFRMSKQKKITVWNILALVLAIIALIAFYITIKN